MTLFIGHSHIDSLAAAAAAREVNLNVVHLWLTEQPIARDEQGVRLNPTIRERLEPLVISLIGGASHDVLGLFEHPVLFDFVLPEQPDLPLTDGATIVPFAAVVAAVKDLISPDEAELASLIAATGSRVVQIESPPPCADHHRLAEDALMFAALWNRPDPSVSPPWLRYKLWRTHSAIVRDRCQAAKIDFLPAPREALLDGCFLAPELYRDPAHANDDYGALVLRQLDILPQLGQTGL